MFMEYQKITNLLDNASSQPSKFRTKNWVEINYEYTVASQMKFKKTMLKSSFCDYSDVYILVNNSCRGVFNYVKICATVCKKTAKMGVFLKLRLLNWNGINTSQTHWKCL